MPRNRVRPLVGTNRRLLAPALCLLLSLALLPDTALAQWWGGGDMEEMENPAIGKRQLKQYATLLGLSREQQGAAADLHAGYDAEYRAAVRRMREINRAVQQEAQQTGEWNLFQSVYQDAGKKFYKRMGKLNQSLLDDLKALLDTKQVGFWDQVQRLNRRQTTMRYGWLSGEKVDLTDIIAGLRLESSADAAISGPLGQYELDLDRELVAREKLIKEQMEVSWSDGDGNFDQSKWEKIWKDSLEVSRKICDVNERYARQIQNLLPPDNQPAFAGEVKLQMYPAVYKKSFAMRVLEAAEKFEDLDPSQRDAIKGLKENYQREAAAINDRWSATVAEIETSGAQENTGQWWGGYGDNPKVQEHRTARKAADDKVVEAVKALLNEEQRKKLPDIKKRPEFDFDAPSPSQEP